ncbi:ProQ/FinO family protein, partial [Aquabacterium sp.]|uniref:ProQ/FinO family protein n=1 Tax=Aquabacterium sp. TaxID=1872578 RepID=UPI0025BD6F73
MSSTPLPPSDSTPAVPELAPAAEPATTVTAAPVDETAVSAAETEPADAAAPQAPGLSPAECAAELKTRFPALFAGSPRPLKLRIQVDIQERAPGVFSKQALSAFFRRYTGSTSYLIAASRAKERFDLDGQPAGELSEEHRQIAVQELARRKTLQNERREKELAERRERAALLAEFEQAAQAPAEFAAAKGLAADKLEATLALARKEAAEPPPAPREDQRHRGPRGGHADRGGR